MLCWGQEPLVNYDMSGKVIFNWQVSYEYKFKEIEVINILILVVLAYIYMIYVVMTASCVAQLSKKTAGWRSTDQLEGSNLLMIDFDIH